MRRTGGLIVPAEQDNESGIGFVSSLVAFVAAAVGTIRFWADLGATVGWISLGLGAFACGIALLRLVIGGYRDVGDVLAAVGALVMGGAAIACVFMPIAPLVGIGFWFVTWLIDVVFLEA